MDIGNSFERFTDTLFIWLPRLAGALIILLITWFVARMLAKLVRRLLTRADIDTKARARRTRPDLSRWIEKISLASAAAKLTSWLVWLAGISIAISVLDVTALNDAVAAVWGYIPHVIAALAILLVAAIVSGAVIAGVRRIAGDTALGKIAATAAPALILTIAVFMALVELEIATEIVAGAFYITLGAIALGAALAFGLGGRNAAQQMLDGALEKGRENAPRMKEEMQIARERGQEEAHRVQERFNDETTAVGGVPNAHSQR
jgi:Conserved TM helix